MIDKEHIYQLVVLMIILINVNVTVLVAFNKQICLEKIILISS